MRQNKYHNQKIAIDGIKFDSKKEARRYKELKLLERAKAITDLKLQPKYLLQPKFSYKGQIQRAVYYIADFSYIQDGKAIVEDVKGHKTEVYKLKRKLFLSKHRDIDFREI